MKGIENFVMEMINMFLKLRRQIAVIIATLLIMAFSAGLTVAHDTGQPHTHDPMDDVCENCNAVDEFRAPIDGFVESVFAGMPDNHPPVAILVVTMDGKVYSLQWLLRHLQSALNAGDSAAPRIYTHSHRHAHMHSHGHTHKDSDSHSHQHLGTQSDPHAHKHSHTHSHEHSHRYGIPHDRQHDLALQDETNQTVSPTQND